MKTKNGSAKGTSVRKTYETAYRRQESCKRVQAELEAAQIAQKRNIDSAKEAEKRSTDTSFIFPSSLPYYRG